MASQRLLLVTFVVLFVIGFNEVNSADPDMLQDLCVADLKSPILVNGFTCRADFSAKDFTFSGLAKPGATNNAMGSVVTPANVMQIPGLNTLGVSMARIDFAPGGLNPPHSHPRGTEMIFMLYGELEVGFITTSPDDKFFTTIIKQGDNFVFPRGLVHFQKNNGKVPAAALAGFNSQNPGLVSIPPTLFAATPPIPDDVLAQAFKITIKEVQFIKSEFASKKY